ncbi:MAG: hypothetical protein RLY93_02220 [Sumerlaeia bacterium]
MPIYDTAEKLLLGYLTIAALWLVIHRYYARTLFQKCLEPRSETIINRVRDRLVSHSRGEAETFLLDWAIQAATYHIVSMTPKYWEIKAGSLEEEVISLKAEQAVLKHIRVTTPPRSGHVLKRQEGRLSARRRS